MIIITGASDGVGEAAARALKARGDVVVVIGRSPEKTMRVASEFDAPYYVADFSRLDDVRTLAGRLLEDFARIDVLANNAGGIMGARALTVDGNERTLQVNHLAPFLLTNLLLDRLIESGASVITTSSIAHRSIRRLDPEDFIFAHDYTPMRAYGASKLMNILFTVELHRRVHSRGIATASFHPGVVRTSFSTEFGGGFSFGYTTFVKNFFRSPDKGAETLVWLASSVGGGWASGEYFKDEKVARSSRLASDPKLARRLWEASAGLTNLSSRDT